MYGDFWYLGSENQSDSCLQPKAGFCEWNSLHAEQAWSESPMAILRVNLVKCLTALSESPMAIIGSKNSKKCKGDSISFEISPQFYNPSKISQDNLDTSSKSTIHQKPAACTPVFWYLESKTWPDSCLQPKAMFCGLNSRCAEQARCDAEGE